MDRFKPPFPLVVIASLLLALGSSAGVIVAWSDGHGWLALVAFVAWVMFEIWAFRQYGMRAAWTLLSLLIFNPVTVFAGVLHYACAVRAACL